MPWRSVLYRSTAILRAVAVTALALPVRDERRLKKAPRAVSVRPTETAAKRRSVAARFVDRRVRELSTLPPEILLPGASVSHDVKCFAVGQRVMSVPHSET